MWDWGWEIVEALLKSLRKIFTREIKTSNFWGDGMRLMQQSTLYILTADACQTEQPSMEDKNELTFLSFSFCG